MAVKRQTLNIPEQALQVLKMLERAGNKAYFVGQCVAELLRGGSPMDYDIITTADFSEMLYVFRDMRIVSQNEDMSSVMVSSLGLVIQVSSYCGEIKDGKQSIPTITFSTLFTVIFLHLQSHTIQEKDSEIRLTVCRA